MAYQYKKTLKLDKRKTGLYRISQASRRISSREYYNNQRRAKMKILVIAISVILFLGLAGYFLFFTSIFRIKNIEITIFKNQAYLVSKSEIKSLIYPLINEKYLYFLPQSNLFLFNSKRLMDIFQKDSRIATLTVDKKIFPPKLEIEIRESEPKAQLVFLGIDGNYYLNFRGQIIASPNKIINPESEEKTVEKDSIVTIKEYQNDFNFTTQEQRIFLPLIYDRTPDNLNSQLITELFKNILDFIESDTLIRNGINISLVEINKEGGIFNIKMVTSEKWYLLINNEVQFDKQLNILRSILEEKIKDRTKIDHIDLRFGSTIFYF